MSFDGGVKVSTSCHATTGAFSFPSVTVVPDKLISIFLDSGGGDKGVLYTRNNDNSTNITG